MRHWACPECGRTFAYELPLCTWCAVELHEVLATGATVIGVTEVRVGSIGHEDVPYWCALTRSDAGRQAIIKLDRAALVGEHVSFATDNSSELPTVGIMGTGTMGRSLTEFLLARGHRVVWCGRSADGLAIASDRVFDRLARTMDDDQLATASGLLAVSDDYAALSVCDVVIEAVIEEADPKRAALAAAERHMRPDAILASNTSGLSIDELASGLERPENFGVLHFFNPATRMRLVETAIGTATSPTTSEFLDSFARSLGKTPVRVAAKPAFAVNRALMPLLNEAIRELEEGVAPAASIDEAIRLGLNHPMGPLALADLIGLDVVLDIMQNLAQRTEDETYAPRPLLRRMVEEGNLGRKTGAGFYTYP